MQDEEAKKVLDLRVVSFDYKEGRGDKGQSGVIAEEAVEIIPQAVNIPDGFDEASFNIDTDAVVPSVDYTKFIPYMIKTIQIQQKEIDDLKKQLKRAE